MSIIKRLRKGFTLIEMLVVVVTIGVITVALIPRVQSVQVRARNTARLADLSQVYKALKLYATNNDGFPRYATGLEGGYISSLPADLMGQSACMRFANGSVGYINNMTRWNGEGSTTIDRSNYYPSSKGYYYGQTVTGQQNGVDLKRRYAVIGAYMEYESQGKPVSNIQWSYRGAAGANSSSYGLGLTCLDQAMYAAIGATYPTLGIGMFGSSYGTSYGSSFAFAYPETMQDPSIIKQAYSELTNAWPQATAFGSAGVRYPYTEGDYIMVVSP